MERFRHRRTTQPISDDLHQISLLSHFQDLHISFLCSKKSHAIACTRPVMMSAVSPPPNFPRELTDLIIRTLINVCANDPCTQWLRLRHITRFHRSYIEQHFLTYWLPLLRLSVYNVCPFTGSADGDVEYRCHSVRKKSGLVWFKGVDADGKEMKTHEEVCGWWVEKHVVRMARDDWSESRMLLRLSSPLLNNGYVGGGIISDCPIPELRCDESAVNLWFDWKDMFTVLFIEQMVLRRVRKSITRKYVKGLRVTRSDKKREATFSFLHENWPILRIEVLKSFRAATKDNPFDITPWLQIPEISFTNSHLSSTLRLMLQEQSIVFLIPG